MYQGENRHKLIWNSSAVIDHLQNTFPEDDIGIAFIYCNYKEQGEQTLVNLIASLLQQVLQRRPLPTKLHALYQHHTSKRTRPTVTECLELLRTELSSHSRAFLVVDALDECDDNNETRTMLLNNLLKLPTTTSLMVTSRHVSSIELQLDQPCCLEIRASDIDMRIYLERQIQRKERLRKHTQKDSSLVEVILEEVVKAAQGMLVYKSYIVIQSSINCFLGFFLPSFIWMHCRRSTPLKLFAQPCRICRKS